MNASAPLFAALARNFERGEPSSRRPLRSVPADVASLHAVLDDATRWARSVQATLRQTLEDWNAGRLKPIKGEEGAEPPRPVTFAEVWRDGRHLRNFAAQQAGGLEDVVRQMASQHRQHAATIRSAGAATTRELRALVSLVDEINDLLRAAYVQEEGPLLAEANREALLILAR